MLSNLVNHSVPCRFLWCLTNIFHKSSVPTYTKVTCTMITSVINIVLIYQLYFSLIFQKFLSIDFQNSFVKNESYFQQKTLYVFGGIARESQSHANLAWPITAKLAWYVAVKVTQIKVAKTFVSGLLLLLLLLPATTICYFVCWKEYVLLPVKESIVKWWREPTSKGESHCNFC